MTTTVEKAIKMLSTAVNKSTGLLHPNDMNKARELFSILHQNGEGWSTVKYRNPLYRTGGAPLMQMSWAALLSKLAKGTRLAYKVAHGGDQISMPSCRPPRFTAQAHN